MCASSWRNILTKPLNNLNKRSILIFLMENSPRFGHIEQEKNAVRAFVDVEKLGIQNRIFRCLRWKGGKKALKKASVCTMRQNWLLMSLREIVLKENLKHLGEKS